VVNPEKDFSFLNAQYSAQKELEYLKKSILESVDRLPMLQTQREEVIFHSSILTVRRSTYRNLLKKIKQDFRTYHAELDDQKPDTLVRFNIQLYPV